MKACIITTFLLFFFTISALANESLDHKTVAVVVDDKLTKFEDNVQIEDSTKMDNDKDDVDTADHDAVGKIDEETDEDSNGTEDSLKTYYGPKKCKKKVCKKVKKCDKYECNCGYKKYICGYKYEYKYKYKHYNYNKSPYYHKVPKYCKKKVCKTCKYCYYDKVCGYKYVSCYSHYY